MNLTFYFNFPPCSHLPKKLPEISNNSWSTEVTYNRNHLKTKTKKSISLMRMILELVSKFVALIFYSIYLCQWSTAQKQTCAIFCLLITKGYNQLYLQWSWLATLKSALLVLYVDGPILCWVSMCFSLDSLVFDLKYCENMARDEQMWLVFVTPDIV